jgi:hypothetical protein
MRSDLLGQRLGEPGEAADVGIVGGNARIRVLMGLAKRAQLLGDGRLSASFLRSAALRCRRPVRSAGTPREMMKRLRTLLPAEPVTPAVRMNLIYADALLAVDDLIEDQVRTALAIDVGNWPFERSRMQFLLRARLRRQRRIQEARGLLGAAQAGFDNLGASPWAERTRADPPVDKIPCG